MNWQLVADILRFVCMPASVVTGALSLRAAANQAYRSPGQRDRFVGLAAVTFGLALGQYHAIGKPPFWPALILVALGVGWSLKGTIPLMRTNSPKPKEYPYD